MVSAYYITIDAPSEITVGQPLTITGNTSYPISDLLVNFYSLVYTPPSIVASQHATRDGPTSESFSSTFPTTGLRSGKYKVEVISANGNDEGHFTIESKNTQGVYLSGPDTETTMPTIATTTQVRITSTPTPVSTTLPPTPVSTILPQFTETTTPVPTPRGNIVPPIERIKNNGSAAIVSLLISLTLFGFIEYSGVYWQNKKRK